MKTKILFKNRTEAGQKLGQALKKLRIKNPIVLAIPNGGVVVGNEVAQALNCPLHPLVSQKIYFPTEKRIGFGAITTKKHLYLSKFKDGLPKEIVDKQINLALKSAQKKEKMFSKITKKPDLKGKTIIIVEDAIATGSTIMAAIQPLFGANIIIATPAISKQALDLLQPRIKKIISLYQHPEGALNAVSEPYDEYSKVSDQKVISLLKRD